MSVLRALRDFVLLPAEDEVEPHDAPGGVPEPPGEPAAPLGPSSEAPSRGGFLPPVPGGAPPAPDVPSAVELRREVPARRGRSRAPATPPLEGVAVRRREVLARRDRSRATAAPPLDGLAVLCRAADADVLATLVGGALRRQHRAPCAVALVWRTAPRPLAGSVAGPLPSHWIAPDDPVDEDPSDHRDQDGAPAPERGSAARPARRLARSLAGRGLAATASGRLVTVELPAGDGQAAQAALDRARAAADAAPVVLVVAGARDAWADGALRRCRHVLVATDDGRQGVADLASAELAASGLHVAVLAVPRGLARPLCARGLLLPASARGALTTLTATTSGAPA